MNARSINAGSASVQPSKHIARHIYCAPDNSCYNSGIAPAQEPALALQQARISRLATESRGTQRFTGIYFLYPRVWFEFIPGK